MYEDEYDEKSTVVWDVGFVVGALVAVCGFFRASWPPPTTLTARRTKNDCFVQRRARSIFAALALFPGTNS